MRLDWITLRLTTVIMTSVKSDKVKQSLDNLEQYRLFTEGNFKPFIHKEFDQCGSILRKIMLEGEIYRLLTQLSLNSRGKKQPRNVFQKLFARVVQSWSGLH